MIQPGTLISETHLTESRVDSMRKLAAPIAWNSDLLWAMSHKTIDVPVEHYPYTKVRFEPRERKTINQNTRSAIAALRVAQENHYSNIAEMLLREP
jgi:hypothetical protein